MKRKMVALVLVILTLAAFAGTASAKARGDIAWSNPGKGQGQHQKGN
ncbi:MAG TPA: hypothetical protein VD902_08760 [Symbiobacteriaceae bacterium]|nr:hypothetical protein [Symbiobacteriaceae bacterium]